MVLSSELHPFKQMIDTSLNTWDSIQVDGCDTVYYCSNSDNKNIHNIIYVPVKEGYLNMGHKTLHALKWALDNREFDYIARVNSSCYVDKKVLIKYIQDLPNENLIAGIETDSQNLFRYLWGGMQYVISRDVVKKVCEKSDKWNHKFMEDESLSLLVKELNIPFYEGKGCSINKQDNNWLMLTYPNPEGNKEFVAFNEIKYCGEHFYRVKCDADRGVDALVMNELFKTLC